MEQLAVKRRITRQRWLRIRFAFARTVELSRRVVQKLEPLPRYQAARDMLIETLAPLNKAEFRMVRDAIADSAVDTTTWYAGGNDFSNQADDLIIRLGISL